jgi:hypothetical protein
MPRRTATQIFSIRLGIVPSVASALKNQQFPSPPWIGFCPGREASLKNFGASNMSAVRRTSAGTMLPSGPTSPYKHRSRSPERSNSMSRKRRFRLLERSSLSMRAAARRGGGHAPAVLRYPRDLVPAALDRAVELVRDEDGRLLAALRVLRRQVRVRRRDMHACGRLRSGMLLRGRGRGVHGHPLCGLAARQGQEPGRHAGGGL